MAWLKAFGHPEAHLENLNQKHGTKMPFIQLAMLWNAKEYGLCICKHGVLKKTEVKTS